MTTGPRVRKQPRAPTLLDALLPVLVLIALLALTIALFGVSATDGPLQVALLLSAAFASLIAFKNGFTVEEEGTPFTTLYFLAKKQGVRVAK